MQHAATLNQQRNGSVVRRRHAFGGAFTQLAGFLLGGCWRHRMGRPFTREGRTYRVCLSCGMTRDFDTATWKTFGPYRGIA
jgi:hypothetical protein